MEYNKPDELIREISFKISSEELSKAIEAVAAAAGVTAEQTIGAIASLAEYLSDVMNKFNKMMKELKELNDLVIIIEEELRPLYIIYYKYKIINNSKIVNIIILYNRWKLYWAKQAIGPDWFIVIKGYYIYFPFKINLDQSQRILQSIIFIK